MAQHFLLSSEARTFSIVKIAKMTEKQAESYFRKVRWVETNGKPVCPNCGCLEHYNLSTRKTSHKRCFLISICARWLPFSVNRTPWYFW